MTRVLSDPRDVAQRIDRTSMAVENVRSISNGFELTVDGEPQAVEDVVVALTGTPCGVEVEDLDGEVTVVRYEEQG